MTANKVSPGPSLTKAIERLLLVGIPKAVELTGLGYHTLYYISTGRTANPSCNTIDLILAKIPGVDDEQT